MNDLSLEDLQLILIKLASNKDKAIELLKQKVSYEIMIKGNEEFCNTITNEIISIKQEKEKAKKNEMSPEIDEQMINTSNVGISSQRFIDNLPNDVISMICTFLMFKEITKLAIINKCMFTIINSKASFPFKGKNLRMKLITKVMNLYGPGNFLNYKLKILRRLKSVDGIEIIISEFIERCGAWNSNDWSKNIWIWNNLVLLTINGYNYKTNKFEDSKITTFLTSFKKKIKEINLKEIKIKNISTTVTTFLDMLYLNQNVEKLSLENIIPNNWNNYNDNIKGSLCLAMNKFRNLKILSLLWVDKEVVNELINRIGHKINCIEINAWDYYGEELSINYDNDNLTLYQINEVMIRNPMTNEFAQQLMKRCPNMAKIHCDSFSNDDYEDILNILYSILNHVKNCQKLIWLKIANIHAFNDAIQKYSNSNNKPLWLEKMDLIVKINVYDDTRQKEIVGDIIDNINYMSTVAMTGSILEYKIKFLHNNKDNDKSNKKSFYEYLKSEINNIDDINFDEEQSESKTKLCFKIKLMH